MAELLGLDIGTSGAKAVVINERGEVIRQAHVGYGISMPRPNWSEQDPSSWWDATERVLAEVDSDQVAAIGLTGQMHGAVMLNAGGTPVRPAILWNDQRTGQECLEVEIAVGTSRLREITGNPMLTGFQLPKLLWTRNNEPEVFEQIEHVLLPKDYIRFRLTGELFSDVSDASGTGCLDLQKRDWSTEVLGKVAIPSRFFPRVLESSQVSAKDRKGRPVVAGAGDQAAGAVGTGAISTEVMMLSLGTSGVTFRPLRSPTLADSPTVHTFCDANRGWHHMGVTLNCAGAISWFRDAFMPDNTFEEVFHEASLSQPGACGVTFLPYLSGERCPLNSSDASGVFFGLRSGSALKDLARAVIEGATFALFEANMAMGGASRQMRAIGGGARSPLWLQLVSDVFGHECSCMDSDEGPAFGAALLAGVGAGVWYSLEEAVENTVRLGSCYKPSSGSYSEPYARFQALSKRLFENERE